MTGRLLCAGLLLPLLLLAAGPPCRAAEPAARCKVRVVLARPGGGGVDPAIREPLKGYLAGSFGTRYDAFELLDTRTLEIEHGTRGEVPLPDDSWLRLTHLGTQGEFIKLSMELPGVKTLIRIRDGGLFFQAGHRYRNGMMILAISATTTGKTTETPSAPRPEPREPHGETHEGRRPAR
ncbi:MAG: hypothetical protein FJ098_05215 [Deltaproteobacteria bacterium]|nr:hypothetical protein [Deltaproteobacteria bacterium]